MKTKQLMRTKYIVRYVNGGLIAICSGKSRAIDRAASEFCAEAVRLSPDGGETVLEYDSHNFFVGVES